MKQAHGLDIPTTLEDACNPKRMALLVYDMQVGVVSQIKNGDQITVEVTRVLDAARNAGIPVFFSRHLSLPKELMGMFQYRMAMAWQKVDSISMVNPWFLRDSPQFEIVPELTPRSSEGIFDKITMSAFEGTYLGIALRDRGIDRFAIAGVAMEIGIEPTVRHATDLGFIPIVVTDACGAGHEDAWQRSLVSLEFTGDALLTDVETLCSYLANR